MCGIAGVIALDEELRTQQRVFERMQETLRRRGPDQRGMYIEAHAALIHTRLSVIDPERGRQPMHFEDGQRHLTIVYNGELYNTSELRTELMRAGMSFTTHADTEVVLKAYAHWGAECVTHMNGIFAFAVWEHEAQRLFLARDRCGVKPLFWHLNGRRLIFGSELKAILAHPEVPHEVGIEGVSQLLLFGPGRTPGCGVFTGMHELRPAYYAYFSAEGMTEHCYWQLTAKEHPDNFTQTAEHVRALLTDAIRRQLISDVPLGTFLSGGLDSSLISSVAAREFGREGKELHTFSVDYTDNEKYFQRSKFQPNADPEYIRRMQAYLDAQHHWSVIGTPALTAALTEAMRARDLPGMVDVDASLLLLCRDIRETVTVALSGECADELFGGYPWYRDPEIRAAYGFPWSQSTAYRMQFAKPDVAELLEQRQDVDREYRATLARTAHLPDEPEETFRMREMMRLNLDWFMQTLLERKDRMSMWNGLEVRVPFCDYRLVEYLYNVPWEFKEHGGYEKGLLRTAMADYLPEEVLWRKKSPYPKTHHPDYLAAVTALLKARLKNPEAPVLQFVTREALERLLHGAENVQWYGQLMTRPQTIAYFLQMDVWMEEYGVTLRL